MENKRGNNTIEIDKDILQQRVHILHRLQPETVHLMVP